MNKNEATAQKIVDRMLEKVKESGYLPWNKPWSADDQHPTRTVVDGYHVFRIPVKHWSRAGRPYQGINIDLLSIDGKKGEMITFAQCKAEGGKVKKGAKASTILYWTVFEKDEPEKDADGNPVLDEDGKPVVKHVKIPVLKEFKVFSVEQDCEGLKTKHHPKPIEIRIPITHVESVDGLSSSSYDATAEAVIASYISRANGLRLNRDGLSDRAFYRQFDHSVTVPRVTQFADIEEYYSTMFHELGHSTGHPSLLNRFTGKAAYAAFGGEEYSREELVAEITSAAILSTLGLESDHSFRNSAAYVQSWSESIKKDPMMYVTAAGRAEKAIALILNQ